MAMARGHTRKRKPGDETQLSERQCIVTGECHPQEVLIRFVVGPEGDLVPDLEPQLPGRGIWLSANRDMINTACAKKLFGKAARQPVTVSDTLADDVGALLARRCLDRISMARRAGQAVAGFDRVAEWLRRTNSRKRGGVLFSASDGAASGRAKVERLAEGMTVVSMFSMTELGGAVGSERTVHLVVASGGLAKALIKDIRRLAGIRQFTANVGDER
jgi:predicted RNA-binding protein YlxR (DUF448 family)